VKLVPVVKAKGKRILHQARGQVKMSPDFDQPMTDAELDEFLGL